MQNKTQIQNVQNAQVFYSLLCVKVKQKKNNFQLSIKGQKRYNQYFLTIQTYQTKIQKISINYLIIAQSNQYNFILNDYIQSLTDKRYFQFINSNHLINYRFIGLKQINIYDISKLSLQFNIQQTRILSLSSSQKIDIHVSLLSISPKQSNVCKNCQGSYTYYYPQDKSILCVKQCSPETIPNYINKTCDSCSSLLNKEVNMISNLCQCLTGFQLSNEGICIIDPLSPFKSVAPCIDSHAKRNWKGQCQCQTNFYMNQLGKCQGNCLQDNTMWNQKIQSCSCLPGFQQFQGRCVIKNCGTHQIFIDGVCRCDQNTIRDNDNQNCILCPAGSFKNMNQCTKCENGCKLCSTESICLVCEEKYYLKQQKCFKQEQQIFKLAKRSPIYISPGIIIDMIVSPSKNKTLQQIYKMFKIQISQKQAEPSQIFLSQDSQNYHKYRLFMNYQGLLPLIDFKIQIIVKLQQINQTKSLQLFLSTISNPITSAVQMDNQDQSYIL